MWYLKYFWVKLNIFILTPLVFIENKIKEINRIKLESYVSAICMSDLAAKNLKK